MNRASDASAPAPPRPDATGATLATLPRRLGSLVYEGLLLTALVLVVGFVLVPLVSPAAGSMHALQVPTAAGRVLSFAGIFGAAMAYCVWTRSAGRRSLPMKTWRLRLVTTDGASVTIGRAAARYVAGWLGPALAVGAFLVLRPTGFGAHAAWLVAFNFLWAFIDPDRQFLHDRLVGTRIVNDGARQ